MFLINICPYFIIIWPILAKVLRFLDKLVTMTSFFFFFPHSLECSLLYDKLLNLSDNAFGIMSGNVIDIILFLHWKTMDLLKISTVKRKRKRRNKITFSKLQTETVDQYTAY